MFVAGRAAPEKAIVKPPRTAGNSPGRGAAVLVAVLAVFLVLALGGGVAAVVLLSRGQPDSVAAAPEPTKPAGTTRPSPRPEPPENEKPNPPAPPTPPDEEKPEPQTPEPQKPQPDPVEPPAGEPLATLTQENFDKIDKGMTKDAIVALLGPPTKVDTSAVRGIDSYLIWKSSGTGPRVTVGMNKDRVITKSTNQPWPVTYPAGVAVKPQPPDGPPAGKPGKANPAVTQENFDKIYKDMTLTELHKLLGFHNRSVPGDGKMVDTFYTWLDGDKQIVISGRLGKVVAKENNQDWPVVYPMNVAQNPPPQTPVPRPPDPGPLRSGLKLTRAMFDKIDKGMTEEAVAALLGPPKEVLKMPEPGVQRRLVWEDAGTRVNVDFLNTGRAFQKSSNMPWPVAYGGGVFDKPNPAITQANFDKIAKDMTREAVLVFMGPPNEKQGTDQDGASSWKGSNGEITLVFAAGKVGFKANQQGWPVVWPKEVAGKPVAVTQEAFDKIDKGMTEEALLALLGPSSQTQKFNRGGIDTRHFWFLEDKSAVTVELLKGEVVAKENNKQWPVVYPIDVERAKFANALTRENYDRIDKDMTLDDLRALFGPPGRVSKRDLEGKEVRWEWTAADRKWVFVTAAQGKVTAKENGQNWPSLYAKDLAAKKNTREGKIEAAVEELRSPKADVRLAAAKDLAEVKADPDWAKKVSPAVWAALGKAQGAEREQLLAAYKVWAGDEDVERLVRVATTPPKNPVLNENIKERMAAAEVLAGMRHPRAGVAVASLLRPAFERETAAKWLTDLGPELAEKAVLGYYHDADPGVQGKAREILKGFKTSEATVFNQAVDDLGHRDAYARAAAVKTIQEAPVDPARRKEVALALDGVVAKNEAVASGVAMIALKKWGTADNVPTLVRQLKAKAEEARKVAMEALGEIKDPAGAEEVAKLLVVDSVLVQDRQNAQKSLTAMGPAAEKATAAYLTHKDAAVRVIACQVLEQVGTNGSVAALDAAAAKGPPEVTQAARAAAAAIRARK